MPKSRRNGYVDSTDGRKSLPIFNISIGKKKRTTVRLAPEIYLAVKKISEIENCDLKEVFEFIFRTKENGISISTAIRVFVIKYFIDAATVEGHRNAGHGSLIIDPNKRDNSSNQE